MSVILETSLGNIVIDLFTEERPKCCKNFLKLCKIKYYNFCLFHSVQRNLVAQSGDPTGTGRGGESVYSHIYGDQAQYFDVETVPRMKHVRAGLISMVNNGQNGHGSQFFITLGDNLDYLDGKHTVFAEVAEGMDIVSQINEAYVDRDNRPYKDIRIYHTYILDDPYDDPDGIKVPGRSPEPTAEQLKTVRIGAEEDIDDFKGKTEEEIKEILEDKEAKANTQILKMVGDLPDADVRPPDTVLFVCKLNPVTTEDDLEVIFSRFGNITSCEVIKDHKTEESLQYAFIEFEKEEECERAYFKMDNVLIDDRRIHVDFSQSVSKIQWNKKGKGDVADQKQNEDSFESRYAIKGTDRKDTKYDLVFEEDRQSKGNNMKDSKEKGKKKYSDSDSDSSDSKIKKKKKQKNKSESSDDRENSKERGQQRWNRDRSPISNNRRKERNKRSPSPPDRRNDHSRDNRHDKYQRNDRDHDRYDNRDSRRNFDREQEYSGHRNDNRDGSTRNSNYGNARSRGYGDRRDDVKTRKTKYSSDEESARKERKRREKTPDNELKKKKSRQERDDSVEHSRIASRQDRKERSRSHRESSEEYPSRKKHSDHVIRERSSGKHSKDRDAKKSKIRENSDERRQILRRNSAEKYESRKSKSQNYQDIESKGKKVKSSSQQRHYESDSEHSDSPDVKQSKKSKRSRDSSEERVKKKKKKSKKGSRENSIESGSKHSSSKKKKKHKNKDRSRSRSPAKKKKKDKKKKKSKKHSRSYSSDSDSSQSST